MGIGGSGISGCASIAMLSGFDVEGSDLQSDSPYIMKSKELGIKTYVGHNLKTLNNVDILAVSPAAFFRDDTSFIDFADSNGIKVMTWQAFMGKYLQKDKKVICISGTHGKSTTTAMASLLFESAGLDPSVMVGATIHEWESNYRFGKGEHFIVESDEFYDNFLNYSPDILILNNIEYDHPDFFENEEQVFESFRKHISNLKGEKVLIANIDDVGVNKILKSLDKELISKLKIIGYTISGAKPKFTQDVYSAVIGARTDEWTFFTVTTFGQDRDFKLRIPGDYNVSNALGLIALSDHVGINTNVITMSLLAFNGVGRRMDLIGEKKGIFVYDDYAHHPTALKVTLKALRQKHPSSRIICVYEPHSFSRTHALLKNYKGAFDNADIVIIAPIFKARDKEEFGVNAQSIVDMSGHKSISAIRPFTEIVKSVVSQSKSGDVIVVMGAGKSYELSKSILKTVKG